MVGYHYEMAAKSKRLFFARGNCEGFAQKKCTDSYVEKILMSLVTR